MKTTITCIFLLLAVCATSSAQDPVFIQHHNMPVDLNPAFAGYEGCARISTLNRIQWPSISATYHTVGFSFDQYLKPVSGGVALSYQFDGAGDYTLNTHTLLLAYSPSFRVFDKKLLISPAIEAGWKQRRLNREKLIFPDQIDPRTGYTYPYDTTKLSRVVRNMLDINAGLLLSHGNFVYGASFRHLSKPVAEIYRTNNRVPIHTTLHFFWISPDAKKIRFSTSLACHFQKYFRTFIPGVSMYFHSVRIGLAYGSNHHAPDDISVIAGYSKKWFSAAYSNITAISKLGNSPNVAHQITFAVKLNCKNKEDRRKGVTVFGY
ncbi:MAG: PorP/SprF family type IX secretion system membrane protein [Bacteroidetes bacterium]|nr:PorP/SprF family type IX secretion system membrane protein [Bacteroidota bacterium]MBU1718677.1 PorP/SprF family type IX secretion system membrane protein [Bacteroidota bacterium]